VEDAKAPPREGPAFSTINTGGNRVPEVHLIVVGRCTGFVNEQITEPGRPVSVFEDQTSKGGVESCPAVGQLLLSTVVLALASAKPAAAQGSTPSTLSAESLGGVPEVTFACNLSATSTMFYGVSGPATGPYPGTFSETGTASLGPHPFPGFRSQF